MTFQVDPFYLGSYLAPLAPLLSDPVVTDIYINRPAEVFAETLGGRITKYEICALTPGLLSRIARQVAALNSQGISRQHPLLSGVLPDGSRIQIAMPPATRGNIAIAIRRHVSAGMSLDDFGIPESVSSPAHDVGMRIQSKDQKPSLSELRDAVKTRKNILISGGTSTGKTTFLNALASEIPSDERLIIIEDTPELELRHENVVGLLAVRGSMGEAYVTAEDLLIASLRMRPDRILLGEMRGHEALTFLRAVNTGHPGSLSTIHADTPLRAIDQLALLVVQAGVNMGWDAIVRYIHQSIDYIIQLERVDGQRAIKAMVRLG